MESSRDHFSSKKLLAEYAEDEEFDENNDRKTQHRPHMERWGPMLAVFFGLIFLLVIDISLLVDNAALRRSQYSGRFPFSGLQYDTPGANQTHADEFWDSLVISPFIIAVTDGRAVKRNNDRSESIFSWDDEEGLYYLKAFQHPHFIKLIHRAWSDNEAKNPSTNARGHIYHCLDALRQNIVCKADGTPMPMILKPDQVGNGEVMMCENIEKLVQWT